MSETNAQHDSAALVDEKAAATRLGLSVETLQQDRVKARRIPYIKIGRRVLYKPSDLSAFIESCRVTAAS